MYSSSIVTQTAAAIAGANITPITPKYFAQINKNMYIIIGCMFNNLPKT